MRHVSTREARRCGLALVLLVLLAGVVNVPAAVMLSPARQTATKTAVNLQGVAVSSREWPVPTPHSQVWPDVTQFTVETAWLGHERITAWGAPTHQMQVDQSGWPLPVLRTVQMWWPWNDPAWTTTAEPDSGLRLAWTGVVLNPVLVGGVLWLVLVVLPLAFVILKRARRARRGLCVWCGYPRGAGEVCSECGRAASGDVGRAIV